MITRLWVRIPSHKAGTDAEILGAHGGCWRGECMARISPFPGLFPREGKPKQTF